MSLLGIALNDTQMINFGRLMLAMEVRSAQQYWYMNSQSSVYQAPFADNKLAGIMWSTKVDFGTWTGPAPEVVLASQIFPVSPIFELVVPPAWVKEAYPVLLKQVGSAAGCRMSGIVHVWMCGCLMQGFQRSGCHSSSRCRDAADSILQWARHGARASMPLQYSVVCSARGPPPVV